MYDENSIDGIGVYSPDDAFYYYYTLFFTAARIIFNAHFNTFRIDNYYERIFSRCLSSLVAVTIIVRFMFTIII